MRLAAALIAALALAGPALAQSESEKALEGATLKVVTEGDLVHRILLNGRVLYVDRSDQSVAVKGIYEGEGHQFGLIEEQSGGNGCPAFYRAIDITTRSLVSEPFGTCSDLPSNIMVKDGALTMTLPRMDGQGTEVYRYAAGKLSHTTHLDKYQPSGPAKAPHDDLAALVDGKSIFEAVKIRALTDALTRVMGPAMFTASRKRIQGGIGSNFESQGDFTSASVNAPHMGGEEETAWAFDHLGHAWASWTTKGKTTFYGNPTPRVKFVLDPRMRR